MSTVTQLHDGNPDGVQVAAATSDKVGFFAATPVDQPTGASDITLTTVTASSPYGFVTATAASEFVAEVVAIRDALVELGLISV